MTDRATQAEQTFREGFNCAQAVIATFGPQLGVHREICLRIATGFGGGMATGRTCGAATGAIMVLSLLHGRTDPADRATYATAKQRVAEFLQRFEARFGHTGCSDLIGVDMTDPAAVQQARAAGRFADLCPHLVRGAAEILLEMSPPLRQPPTEA